MPLKPERKSMADVLYPAAVQVNEAFDAQSDALFAALGATANERDALRASFVTIADETGLPGPVVADLVTEYVRGEVQAARAPDATAHAAAVQAAIREGNDAVRRELAAAYGAKKPQVLLARTQAWV